MEEYGWQPSERQKVCSLHIKSFYNLSFVPLGIVTWILLSLQPLSVLCSDGFPSWHINGHGERCRKNFCLGYTRGAGRTCGEEVEMTWSSTNSLAPSVREMVPGARHDTLNNHWNGWNFRKIMGFRTFHSVILFDHQISLLVLLKRYLVFEAVTGGCVDEF